jgi:hypothetical protein
MRPADGFLATAAAVLIVNAVAAVLLGCSLYAVRYLYRRFVRPAEPMSVVASIAE